MRVSLDGLHTRLLCLLMSHSPAHEIIAHDPAEDEPCRSDRTSQCATDFRFSNSRIVADGNLDNPITRERTLQDHLHCPAVRLLFQRELPQDISTRGAKRPQIADPLTIQHPNHDGREAITECRMPG